MRKHFFSPIIFLILIASCKKDNSNPSTSAGLLYKIVEIEGADSLIYTYTYDAQNRIMTETLKDTANSQTYTLILSRDSRGRITKLIDDVQSVNPGLQTTDFFYLTATDSKIRYAKAKKDFVGAKEDSIAFEYNIDRVSKIAHHSFNGRIFQLAYFHTYSYDSRNNLSKVETYELDASGTNILRTDQFIYTYDDKINPLFSTDDALIDEFDIKPYVSPNNVTSLVSFSSIGPGNSTRTSVYEYRSDGRPLKKIYTGSGIGTIVPETTVSTFFYR